MKKYYKTKENGPKLTTLAFTLIELIAVLVILAILAFLIIFITSGVTISASIASITKTAINSIKVNANVVNLGPFSFVL